MQVDNEHIYNETIDDVITNLRELFYEEGVKEDVLQQLKEIWKNKLYEHANNATSIMTADSSMDKGRCILTKDNGTHQIDGLNDTSSDDEEESKVDDNGSKNNSIIISSKGDEEELNSDDDLADDGETLDTENLIVCKYEKIHRRFNRWTMQLTNGIMNLNRKDYFFKTLTGKVEW